MHIVGHPYKAKQRQSRMDTEVILCLEFGIKLLSPISLFLPLPFAKLLLCPELNESFERVIIDPSRVRALRKTREITMSLLSLATKR